MPRTISPPATRGHSRWAVVAPVEEASRAPWHGSPPDSWRACARAGFALTAAVHGDQPAVADETVEQVPRRPVVPAWPDEGAVLVILERRTCIQRGGQAGEA